MAGWRIGGVGILAPITRDLLEEAIDHAEMVMEVRVQGRAEAMEKAHGPHEHGGGGPGEASFRVARRARRGMGRTAPTIEVGMGAGRWPGWWCGPPDVPVSGTGLCGHRQPPGVEGSEALHLGVKEVPGSGGERGEGPGASGRDLDLVRPVDGWKTVKCSGQEYAIEPMSRGRMRRLGGPETDQDEIKRISRTRKERSDSLSSVGSSSR